MEKFMDYEDLKHCQGLTNVSKKCPYCRVNNVTYDKVIFDVVTSTECKCGKLVCIKMMGSHYYRLW